MVSSAPTILRPQVRIPSTPSMLFQFVLLKLYRENNENKKQKEAGIGPFLKKIHIKLIDYQKCICDFNFIQNPWIAREI